MKLKHYILFKRKLLKSTALVTRVKIYHQYVKLQTKPIF